MTPLVAESIATSSMTDADLAAAAGVPAQAVTMFRSGIPHWSLEQKGVLSSIAKATGLDEGLVRASFHRAKQQATNHRASTTSAVPTFGHVWPTHNLHD